MPDAGRLLIHGPGPRIRSDEPGNAEGAKQGAVPAHDGRAGSQGLEYGLRLHDRGCLLRLADQVFELLDPQTLIAEYRSDSRHLASGLPYRNSYLGILRFRDGQVCYWREDIKPQTITELQKAVEASTSHEHDEA